MLFTLTCMVLPRGPHSAAHSYTPSITLQCLRGIPNRTTLSEWVNHLYDLTVGRSYGYWGAY